MIDITNAKLTVEDMYSNLSEIVDSIVTKQTKSLDNVVKKLSKIDTLTNDELRNLMITVSVEAYTLSNLK